MFDPLLLLQLMMFSSGKNWILRLGHGLRSFSSHDFWFFTLRELQYSFISIFNPYCECFLSGSLSNLIRQSPSGKLSIPDLLYIKKLFLNLLSVSQLRDLAYSVLFPFSPSFVQEEHSGKLIGIGHRVGRLYVVKDLPLRSLLPIQSAFSSWNLL